MHRRIVVSVVTYIPIKNNVEYETLKIVLKELVLATHPEFTVVNISKGNDNPHGINAIWIKTRLNKMTKDQLEDGLGKIFGKRFQISYTRELRDLNATDEIRKSVEKFT